jgi:hypothetical protein
MADLTYEQAADAEWACMTAMREAMQAGDWTLWRELRAKRRALSALIDNNFAAAQAEAEEWHAKAREAHHG